jgi:predicted DNA-binding transcriptional regulator AlpA
MSDANSKSEAPALALTKKMVAAALVVSLSAVDRFLKDPSAAFPRPRQLPGASKRPRWVASELASWLEKLPHKERGSKPFPGRKVSAPAQTT